MSIEYSNHEICKKFVEKNVGQNVSAMIYAFGTQQAFFSNESEYSYEDDVLPLLSRSDPDDPEETTTCEEHFIVNEIFGEKLKAEGEAVGELFGLTIWGRVTSGQGIAHDAVVQRIAEQSGILVGGKYEWEW